MKTAQGPDCSGAESLLVWLRLAPIVACALACGGEGEASPSSVSFEADVAPIFASKCVTCHHPDSATLVDLTNPFDPELGIIDRPNTWVPNGSTETVIVDPGNVANSFLITKVAETDLDAHVDGAPMPMVIAPLTEAELAAVDGWIADGAQDDAVFAEQVAPILGTEITLGRASGKCTFCHYPDSPQGVNVLDPFDAETGLVDADSQYGGKIVAPGDPEASILSRKLHGLGPGAQMPLEYPRLTQSEIDTLIAWVEGGAKDD